MQTLVGTLTALTLVGLWGTTAPAHAQAPAPATGVTAGAVAPAANGQAMPKVLVNVSTLIGSKVRDSAGQDVGEIKELMVDASSGQVAYAVLAAGGVLGVGRTLFAVPFESLTVSQDRSAIVLNARSDVLPRAPSLPGDKVPNMGDQSVQDRVQAYWQDASITAAVKWKLATDRIESLKQIDVSTDQGAVALRGSVPSDEMKMRAEALAKQVAGVRRVDNNLQVRN
jgi:osmotically-inducible protein OsmY